MTMRECIKTLSIAKAIALEFVLKKERNTNEIVKHLQKEVGEEWKKIQTINLLNLCDDVFEIAGFDNKGTYWTIKQEVWERCG